MKKTMFRNIPAVNNKRPNGPLGEGDSRKGQKTHAPVTYVWVTKPGSEVTVDGIPMGLVTFRRAW